MNSKISEIWYTFCPVVCPSHVAQHKGWLKEEFARDEIKVSHISTLPSEHWRAHYSHRHAQLFREGGNIPPIWARSEGVATKVIGMLWVEQAQAILVRKDSTIKSVAELKGKRIVVPRRLPSIMDHWRANALRCIIMSLQAHGLMPDDVRLVDLPIDVADMSMTQEKASDKTEGQAIRRTGWKIPQQPEVEAIQRGEVDAMYSLGGQVAMLEQAGLVKVIYNLDKHPDWRTRVNREYPHLYTVNADFAAEHPELVTRWMKVVIRAGLWAKENYNEVVRMMAQELEGNATEEAIKKSFSPDFHKHLVPEISDRGIEALEIQKRFLREHGFIYNDFDVRSWVDGSFLSAAAQELEAVVR